MLFVVTDPPDEGNGLVSVSDPSIQFQIGPDRGLGILDTHRNGGNSYGGR
jgi:hypothetical protein